MRAGSSMGICDPVLHAPGPHVRPRPLPADDKDLSMFLYMHIMHLKSFFF